MTVNINLDKNNSYDITIDKLSDKYFDTKVVIVTNPTVSGFHLEYLKSKISAKSLSVWLKAYREGGPQALEGRPGLTKGKNRKAAPISKAIRDTKRQFPDFGLRKVRDYLKRFFGFAVSTGTINKEIKIAM